jgi:hypothetical protein
VRIPAGLAWWRSVAAGAAWLDGLPAFVDACAERRDMVRCAELLALL